MEMVRWRSEWEGGGGRWGRREGFKGRKVWRVGWEVEVDVMYCIVRGGGMGMNGDGGDVDGGEMGYIDGNGAGIEWEIKRRRREKKDWKMRDWYLGEGGEGRRT
jgi:hypothetical protein